MLLAPINALQDTFLHQLVTDVSKHELPHFRDDFIP